jgi:hypothetical protein
MFTLLSLGEADGLAVLGMVGAGVSLSQSLMLEAEDHREEQRAATE